MALIGLSACTERPVEVDAAPDVGADDGRDAARTDADPPDDSGRDARAPDAWVDPAWRAVPDTGDCPIDVAVDPLAVLEPLRIDACPDMAGCRRMSMPWERDVAVPSTWSGWFDGAHGHVLLQAVIDGTVWYIDVRDDGVPNTIVRVLDDADRPECLATVGIGDGRIALAVHRSRSTVDIMVVAADLTNAAATAHVVDVLTEEEVGTSTADYVAVSRDVIALQVLGGVIRMENDGSHTEIASSPDDATSYAGPVVGEHVLVETLGPVRNRIEISSAPGALASAYLSSESEVSTPVFDGTSLSWLQLSGRLGSFDFAGVELWTSAWNADPTLLEPRRVAPVRVSGPMRSIIAGGGYVSITRGETGQSVFRLSDGYEAVLPRVIGYDYAGPEELGGGYTAGESDNPFFYFVRYDALTYAPAP